MHTLQLVRQPEIFNSSPTVSFPHASCFFLLSGAPLLGSTESIRATLSGTTSGLPVTEVSFNDSYSIAIILYKMNGTTIPLELVTQLSYR
jgi:hypothetical protein